MAKKNNFISPETSLKLVVPHELVHVVRASLGVLLALVGVVVPHELVHDVRASLGVLLALVGVVLQARDSLGDQNVHTFLTLTTTSLNWQV